MSKGNLKIAKYFSCISRQLFSYFKFPLAYNQHLYLDLDEKIYSPDYCLDDQFCP